MKLGWFQKLGPGLLYAGAAVGVSHLIQSTRAGADFGYQLVWAVVIAIVLKYPFFEFGPRYAAATGKNLLFGYQKIGKWSVVLFFVLTFLSMFVIQSAVTMVTAGIVAEVFNVNLPIWSIAALVLGFCCLLLLVGKYQLLDKSMKFIIVLLSVATISTFVIALFGDYDRQPEFLQLFSFNNHEHILFLIALMGWMPAPFDIAVWHSIWTTEKQKTVGEKITLKNTLFDFKIGYWATLILSLAFLGLGAVSFYGTGIELSGNGAIFTAQLLEIYTNNIGSWAYLIVAIAALTTMISTTLTCLDAQPRVMEVTIGLMFPTLKKIQKSYWIWLTILSLGTVIIIAFFATNMKTMIDFATAIAFLSSPLLAILNYLAITHSSVPKPYQPKLLLKILSFIGIAFFIYFSLHYLVVM